MAQQVTLQWFGAGRIIGPVLAGLQRTAGPSLSLSIWSSAGLCSSSVTGAIFRRGAGLQFDTLLRTYLEEGRFDQLAVDSDPAALDVQLGLAPGTAELLGDAFGKAHGIGHGMLGEIRRRERGEPVQSGSPKAVRVSASLLADGDLPGRALGLATHAVGDGLDLTAGLEERGHLLCQDWLVSVAGSGLRLALVVLVAMDRFSFNQSNRALYRFDQILFSFYGRSFLEAFSQPPSRRSGLQ